MNKLTKEKRDRLILVVLVTAAVLGAMYLLIVSAQRTALEECIAKIDSEQQKLEKAERWLRMAPGIETRLSACRGELDSKQEGMAPVDKFKWFYNTLETFLARHNVKLVDITREPELGEAGVLPKFPYKAATFGVKLMAPFHDFGRFLADFENQFPYMRVQNLEMEPEAESRVLDGSSAIPSRLAGSREALAITMRVVTLVKPAAPL